MIRLDSNAPADPGFAEIDATLVWHSSAESVAQSYFGTMADLVGGELNNVVIGGITSDGSDHEQSVASFIDNIEKMKMWGKQANQIEKLQGELVESKIKIANLRDRLDDASRTAIEGLNLQKQIEALEDITNNAETPSFHINENTEQVELLPYLKQIVLTQRSAMEHRVDLHIQLKAICDSAEIRQNLSSVSCRLDDYQTTNAGNIASLRHKFTKSTEDVLEKLEGTFGHIARLNQQTQDAVQTEIGALTYLLGESDGSSKKLLETAVVLLARKSLENNFWNCTCGVANIDETECVTCQKPRDDQAIEKCVQVDGFDHRITKAVREAFEAVNK